MKKQSLLVFILFALIFISGFGERPGSIAPVQISTDKLEYKTGELVKMMVTYTNTSTESISTYYPSGQKYDILIKDKNKNDIWRWSYGKMFIMSVQPIRLGPGKSVSFNYSWHQKDNEGNPVPPGKYYIAGEITISPRVRSAEKTITIK